MIHIASSSATLGCRAALLISVRDAAEAVDAIAGGADIVDAKEPSRGALGPVNSSTLQAIASKLPRGMLLTAAAGEISHLNTRGVADWIGDSGLAVLKVGAAGCSKFGGWRDRFACVQASLPVGCDLAIAAYADWQAADSPRPDEVLAAVVELQLKWMLIDTFDKRSGGLFRVASALELKTLVDVSRRAGVSLAIAGGLSISGLRTAAMLRPEIVGARGAVCEGGRAGRLSAGLVAQAKRNLYCREKT